MKYDILYFIYNYFIATYIHKLQVYVDELKIQIKQQCTTVYEYNIIYLE